MSSLGRTFLRLGKRERAEKWLSFSRKKTKTCFEKQKTRRRRGRKIGLISKRRNRRQ